ncbi:hypothetical protein MLD38_039977 [Melastoma candidum]|uniref:Uncharacterized protein n=1 Tax=Melastoma candidum TaxID=119954 RepID=A0ACB9L4J0_9MYRT|nr:hypothetical protein MLD38_039977 [Melastoma candidum]
MEAFSSSSASASALVGQLVPYALTLFALLLLMEQLSYLSKKRHLPGPSLVLPFLGNALLLVLDPSRFWSLQSRLASSSPLGLSTNYLVGRFILFVGDTHLSHLIFNNVRPDAFHLIGHPFGKKLFGDHNLIYLMGQEHKDLRRRIAPNFTPSALSTYTSLQQLIILDHLRSWVSSSSGNPIPLRVPARDLNLETSQTVFVGPYLSDDDRLTFAADYNLFNVGLMKLPFDLPGFAFRKARLAVGRLVDTLSACTAKSKARMEKGEEPRCLIDFWMQETVKETLAAREAGEGPPPHSDDKEIGGHLFDFLFASQDASTSSLLWAVTLLDQHQDVLAKVREEVAAVWSWESDTLITAEQLRGMKYTEAVAREVIRYRAPATMVPHIAAKDFKLTETYTIPKGTIVFPSVFESSFQGFPEADRFDPERFLEGRQEDREYKKYFLAFGWGAHQCVGQRYALNHLMLFIAMFSTLVEFERARSEGCDDIAYVPTIIPRDECRVRLRMRCERFPRLRMAMG